MTINWSNIYPAPNFANADSLINNISTLQNSAGSGYLPFNNYGGYGSFGNYGNPFMNTSYNYSQDADGNITSNFSQRPDYLGIGLSSLGVAANAVGSVLIAGQQSKVMQQQQLFENMAYQQQASNLAQIQQRQMNQQTMKSTMEMMMNIVLMQQIMGNSNEA